MSAAIRFSPEFYMRLCGLANLSRALHGFAPLPFASALQVPNSGATRYPPQVSETERKPLHRKVCIPSQIQTHEDQR